MTENKKNTATTSEWVDPDDAPELTAEWFAGADLYEGDKLVKRGRPALAHPKEAVSIRLDADLLTHLRGLGPGWQTKVNQLLRDAAGL